MTLIMGQAVMMRWIACVAVLALTACGREEPLPVGIKRPSATAACQIPAPSGQPADALYRLARKIDARVCEHATGATFIFPVNQTCDEEAAGAGGTLLTLSEAGDKLQACNLFSAPRRLGGRYSTLIALEDPAPSPGRVRDAQIRLQDIAMRVPLGARNVMISNHMACFQYDDAPTFRDRLERLRRYLPRKATVEHFDAPQCAALLIVRSRTNSAD